MVDISTTMPWLPIALFAFVAVLSVGWQLGLFLLQFHEARWTVAGILGAAFASLTAPSPWIAAFLLTVALSIPVSLLAFRAKRISHLSHPVPAAGLLAVLSLWVVALGITSTAMKETGVLQLLTVFLVCAAYNTVLGWIQVRRGIQGIVCRDRMFGEPGKPVRQPMGWLHNPWKPAAINAMLLPVVVLLGLRWSILTIPLWLLAVGMCWQIRATGGLTCQIGAGAGILASLVAVGYVLPALILVPLSLTAYPAARRQIRDDPRWEAWRQGWYLLRKNRFLGIGLGGWSALSIQTAKEPGRKWHNAHNDWLETLVECGPLPVLCVLGYLGTAVARVAGGVNPLEAGLFGSVIALAVLAVGYMPWRMWPVNLFAVGILASWEALAR